MEKLDQLTEADIAQCLSNCPAATHDAIPAGEQTYRDAGVLVPFVRVMEAWHLLFIRRPDSVHDRHHSGQVAFAGGKHEPEDPDLITTALREAHEEIGVAPQDVQVLGQLGPHHSISQYRIAPVVATLPWPYTLTPSPQEVARAFTIPLQWLAQPGQYEIRYHQLPGFMLPVPVVYFREYDHELLWGATARITLSLLDCLQTMLKHR